MGILLPIAGALLGGIGQMIKNRQAANDAKARVDARNKVLSDTMALNKPLADASRAAFDARMVGPIADEMAPSLRGSLLAQAGGAPPGGVPIAASAPSGVQAEIAGQMARAVEAGRSEAAASAKVGSYGDAWFDEGVQNGRLGSQLGQNANFAGGNLALLPALQDLAEVGAVKTHGPLADIFAGLGSAMGAAGGATRRTAAPVIPAPATTGIFQGVRNHFFGTG